MKFRKEYYDNLQHKLEIDFKNKMKIEQVIYKQAITARMNTVIDNSVVTNYWN